MDLSVKNFDSNTDLDQQRKLFKACFPETSGTALGKDSYYFWKFHQAPDKKASSYEYGAYIKNKLVGYYGWIPFPYNIDGKEATEVIACDAVVDSSYRKKGIFSKLGSYSLEQLKASNVDFTVGYALRPEVIPGHLKVGWKIGFNLPFYVKILDSRSILKSKKLFFLTPIVNIFFRIYNSFSKINLLKSSSFIVQSVDANELVDLEEYDVFFRDWSSQQRYYLIKSREFLRWRLGSPETRYSITIIKWDEKIVALAISTKRIIDGIPFLGIVDLMVLDDHYSCLPLVYQEMESIAKSVSAELIGIIINKTWRKRFALFSNGFIRSPITYKFIINKLNDKLDYRSLLNEKNWCCTWLNSDHL